MAAIVNGYFMFEYTDITPEWYKPGEYLSVIKRKDGDGFFLQHLSEWRKAAYKVPDNKQIKIQYRTAGDGKYLVINHSPDCVLISPIGGQLVIKNYDRAEKKQEHKGTRSQKDELSRLDLQKLTEKGLLGFYLNCLNGVLDGDIPTSIWQAVGADVKGLLSEWRNINRIVNNAPAIESLSDKLKEIADNPDMPAPAQIQAIKELMKLGAKTGNKERKTIMIKVDNANNT